MARMQVQPGVAFGAAVVVLFAGALLPVRVTGWLTSLRGPLSVLVSPIAGPLSSLSEAVRPIAERGGDDLAAAELQTQRDELRLLYERAAGRVADLERLVAELQRLPLSLQERGVVPVLADRVGRSTVGGTIDVRAGADAGGGFGTVAVARQSNQLVGLVTTANGPVSTVRVITDERIEPGILRAVLSETFAESPEAQARLPRADFGPDGRGGCVAEQVPVEEGAPTIEVGMLARLDDPDWPEAAQFYTLGEVTSVEPGDAPLFVRVTIEPLVDVSRVRSVLLLTRPGLDDVDGGGG